MVTIFLLLIMNFITIFYRETALNVLSWQHSCSLITLLSFPQKQSPLNWLISVVRGQRSPENEEPILLKLVKDRRGEEKKVKRNSVTETRRNIGKLAEDSTKCKKISEKTEFNKLRSINRITSAGLTTWMWISWNLSSRNKYGLIRRTPGQQ